ncbi:MAG: hypothetical protein JNG84_02840 [Archangium sp.]|nr:hypothetical protein [Archangium sp.]
MTEGRSPVHRIIDTFSRALTGLGLQVPPLFIERWGVAVHQSLSSRAREFHTHQHVLDLVADADPLETIAALYHDTVYVQVDLGVPEHFESLLSPFIRKEDAGWRIQAHAADDPTARDVLHIFGLQAGAVLTTTTGLNEFASALVAARELEGVLTREQLLAVSACIEGTIPFRDGEGDQLVTRLTSLGLAMSDVAPMVRRAVRLSNNDVGNFAEEDPARFLDNTWKLLPETNPSLMMPTTYGVHDYRVALMKMEGFLSHLPAERVFHAWDGEPSPAHHERRVTLARRNLALAVRYMRAKLYSTSLIEALAVESGGDAPIDFFLGGIAENGMPVRRIEQYLPQLPVAGDGHEPMLTRLLQAGRTTSSSFDTSPSPLAAFLYSALGEARTMAGYAEAHRWWKGEVTARQFLTMQPVETTAGLALAAAEIADTRRDALHTLANTLRGK